MNAWQGDVGNVTSAAGFALVQPERSRQRIEARSLKWLMRIIV